MPENDVYDLVYDYDTDMSVYDCVYSWSAIILKTTLIEAMDVFHNYVVGTNR